MSGFGLIISVLALFFGMSYHRNDKILTFLDTIGHYASVFDSLLRINYLTYLFDVPNSHKEKM